MTNDIPAGGHVLATRIPAHRTIEGLEYGRHVVTPGWSGYYVRPADSALLMAVARMTPADNELVGDDAETVEAIEAELDTLTTTAEKVAAAFGNDGQCFEHAASGQRLEAACEDQAATVEHGVREYSPEGNGSYRVVAGYSGDHIAGDPVRYVFPDGSAIVIAGDGWDIEGAAPFSWAGA
jgi:hypothetical protein